MPVRFKCSNCDKALKVAEEAAGKRIRCPDCQTVVRVPAAPPANDPDNNEFSQMQTADDDIPDDWLTGGEANASIVGSPDESDPLDVPTSGADLPPRVVRKSRDRGKSPGTFVPGRDASEALPNVRRRSEKPASSQPAMAGGSPAPWRDHLLWVLLAALTPLAISTVADGEPPGDRLQETLRQNPAAAPQMEAAHSKEDFFAALPEKKLVGAHLPHGTWLHWGYAAISATLFLAFLTQTFPNSVAGPSRLFWTGVATGTAGILLLLGFQWVAMWTQGFNVRGRGILVLLFYIVKFIGYSYRSALDPENGFFLSFLGFTCGVGLCEELCKALPVVLFLRGNGYAGWKAACVVGLASGVGFGVSEGVTYSSDSYNGVAVGMMYLVRFASCVALHAMWAGSVALLMCRNQDYLGEFDWGEVGNFILHYLALAMVLHGLYDTLLKKDHEIWALAIAVISFGWLVWLVRAPRNEG